MVIFKKNLKAKSEPDIHQNVPNCTCPRNPLSKHDALRRVGCIQHGFTLLGFSDMPPKMVHCDAYFDQILSLKNLK